MTWKTTKKRRTVISLWVYDIAIFLASVILWFVIYKGVGIDVLSAVHQCAVAFASVFCMRFALNIYSQIWRYGGISCYIRLLLSDMFAFVVYLAVSRILPIQRITLTLAIAFFSSNLLAALTIRMAYRYAYKYGNRDTTKGKLLRLMLKIFSGGRVSTEAEQNNQKTDIAIIGAGTVGTALAEELLENPRSRYVPRCFIDIDPQKSGREIHGLPVWPANDESVAMLRKHGVEEIVFAIPNMEKSRKFSLYDHYSKAGLKVKVFDYPLMDAPDRKRVLRDMRVEDLLMRPARELIDDRTREYYRDKAILITGGGGSIGSELCRQLAAMSPRQLIVVDIYENSAYELQQSLRFLYGDKPDVRVEIASVANKEDLARVFAEYRPDICIHAAAHKHVPLMEKNVIEAIKNNVIGTLNTVQLCEEYHCGRFMLVSTDKAVNPTNVMGATKRMCEMIVQAYSTVGKVRYSATRFGNVLGSAGSVIPLFRKQIAAGGPVTVTDKRIVRYFMSIPEASQLVLVSGALAQNDELFVLDMGDPVRIYDLAANMIRMSGMSGIEIVETGLRPGEKMYEELLVDRDTMEKTENDLIFIEHEAPVSMDTLYQKLTVLRGAIASGNDEKCREALKQVVPTYQSPDHA